MSKRKKASDSATMWQCSKCQKSFKSESLLSRHLKTNSHKHKSIGKHQCDVCGKVYRYASVLFLHQIQHMEKKPHECELCDKSFARPTYLKMHMLSHSGKRLFKCDECGKGFNDSTRFNDHKKMHEGIRSYTCEICGESFFYKQNLKHHQLNHNEEKQYKCSVVGCDKKFHLRDSWLRHQKSHGRYWRCEMCGQSYRQKNNLIYHMTLHAEERCYQCALCEASCATREELRSHQLTHSDLKAFVCEVCGKKFKSKASLTSHSATHSKNKSNKPIYKCQICKKQFTSKASLFMHERNYCQKPGLDKTQGGQFPSSRSLDVINIHRDSQISIDTLVHVVNLDNDVHCQSSYLSKNLDHYQGTQEYCSPKSAISGFSQTSHSPHSIVTKPTSHNPPTPISRGALLQENLCVQSSSATTTTNNVLFLTTTTISSSTKLHETNNSRCASTITQEVPTAYQLPRTSFIPDMNSAQDVRCDYLKVNAKPSFDSNINSMILTSRMNSSGRMNPSGPLRIATGQSEESQISQGNCVKNQSAYFGDKISTPSTNKHNSELLLKSHQMSSVRNFCSGSPHDNIKESRAAAMSGQIYPSITGTSSQSKLSAAVDRSVLLLNSEQISHRAGKNFDLHNYARKIDVVQTVRHGQLQQTCMQEHNLVEDQGLIHDSAVIVTRNDEPFSQECQTKKFAPQQSLSSNSRDGFTQIQATTAAAGAECNNNQHKHTPTSPKKSKSSIYRRKYKCTMCDRGFSRLVYLEEHQKQHLAHKCDFCDEKFLTLAALKTHDQQVHEKDKEAGSADSDSGNDDDDEFEKYVLSADALGESRSRLAQGQSKENYVEADDREMKNLSKVEDQPRPRPFKCNVCGKAYYERTNLRRHTRTHTGEKPYKCETCGVAFSLRNSLKAHSLTHSEDRPHQCGICGKTFKVKWNLQNHYQCHRSDRPFECTTCGMTFKHNKSYLEHKALHDKQPLFMCSLCGKRFVHMYKLNSHMLNHTSERPHKCNTCGKSFKTRSNLVSHSKVHSGEKPFKCDLCDYASPFIGRLNEHRATHSSESWDCFCGKTHKSRKALKMHQNRVHKNEAIYICDQCGSRFLDSATLEEHKASHSGQLSHKCAICKASFKTLSLLLQHQKGHKSVNSFRVLTKRGLPAAL